MKQSYIKRQHQKMKKGAPKRRLKDGKHKEMPLKKRIIKKYKHIKEK